MFISVYFCLFIHSFTVFRGCIGLGHIFRPWPACVCSETMWQPVEYIKCKLVLISSGKMSHLFFEKITASNMGEHIKQTIGIVTKLHKATASVRSAGRVLSQSK